MDFRSDNTCPAHPNIMKALNSVADSHYAAYGDDVISQKLDDLFSEVFATPVSVYPVITGTAANCLALATWTPPYGSIFCHEESHINTDECGGPEFFTSGAKLIPLPGDHGKITPETLLHALAIERPGVHRVQPAGLSLSQTTECGTVYTIDEIKTLSHIAHGRGLFVHMDGARFSNAVASLNCHPADITWRAGIDALSFGATKNGCLAAEVIVFFKSLSDQRVAFLRKRSGHLVSKQWYLSAQWQGFFHHQLWLDLARHANQMAQYLAEGLGSHPHIHLVHPVMANEVFAQCPLPLLEKLRTEGCLFYDWPSQEPGIIRLVTSYYTKKKAVDCFLKLVHEASQ